MVHKTQEKLERIVILSASIAGFDTAAPNVISDFIAGR